MSRLRGHRSAAVATLLAWAVVALSSAACRPPTETERRPERLPLSVAMSPGEMEGFARADEPRRFVFPDDHGPHPAFRTEWWYVTGNLTAVAPSAGSSAGRDFGYQLTVFRSALEPPGDEPRQEASDWRTDALYMGHLALTDIEAEEFLAFERFSRGAAGLAGAQAKPFRVWIEDWSLLEAAAPDDGIFPLLLVAADGEVGLELELVPEKPLVLQGDGGLSRKGASPGNASYYYSFTRLGTTGTVRVGERRWRVEGTSWLDREWSTSALEPGVVGWDWFALQLSDGRDLMVYRLRRDDGGTDPHSAGVLVEPDGDYEVVGASEFTLRETARWESPQSGAVYPAGWRLAIPAAEVDLVVEPRLAAQEHTGSVLYWEGAVTVDGTSAGVEVDGRGYVELTGYGGPGAASPPS
ncbi:MAG: lipocalin-like domain-containing protein [Thermoanaerobaculia bacterium]|nr:lipocalin-like domain-containing protein [Thermoanaerobaculia bacterium]